MLALTRSVKNVRAILRSTQKTRGVRSCTLATMAGLSRPKLHGRAFYESIGSPKLILAPMVDRSEFAWRLLTRSYLDEHTSKSLLAYTPMFHGRIFGNNANIRDEHFQPTRSSLTSKAKSSDAPWLDGNPTLDRPLFVQFCANKPEEFLNAAQYVAPYCDAVDLNLGCPQGIAKAGQYGSFLQEDWKTIHALISKLHNELTVPVTAKMRILDTKETTLEYAKMILSAGASILTVHGRRREQKGHNTGIADWEMIRYLRENLPPETVLFANGNILNAGDLEGCLAATGADGVMSAEGNLSDPTIFAKPPADIRSREYWRGADGVGGYRLDAVFRRYLDIIYGYVLEQDPPTRPPLYVPGDPINEPYYDLSVLQVPEPAAKSKRATPWAKSPNLRAMQGHLFHMFKHIVPTHIEIRGALSSAKVGHIQAYEKVLRLLEAAIRKALDQDQQRPWSAAVDDIPSMTAQDQFIARYRRPWWVCQPHIRPLPEAALLKGSMQLSKKEKLNAARNEMPAEDLEREHPILRVADTINSENPNGAPREALVCG